VIKVPTEAQFLKSGDRVELQGLVISVIPGFAKAQVKFKDQVRLYPNSQVVNVLVPEVPLLVSEDGQGA